MITPARHPRIDEPVETCRQIFDHTAHLPSPRTGNGRHHPQSAAGPTFMREPWSSAAAWLATHSSEEALLPTLHSPLASVSPPLAVAADGASRRRAAPRYSSQ